MDIGDKGEYQYYESQEPSKVKETKIGRESKLVKPVSGQRACFTHTSVLIPFHSYKNLYSTKKYWLVLDNCIFKTPLSPKIAKLRY